MLERIRELTERLSRAGVETARLDAEVLLGHVLDCDRAALFTLGSELSSSKTKELENLVSRRLKGEPIAYLLGHAEFYGRRFLVDQSVLIPRPETEELVQAVLDCSDGKTDVLEFGAGSGCIGLTLALESPQFSVTAIEKSEVAYQKCLENVSLNGSPNNYEVRLCEVSGFESDSKFDVVVSNPPYISAASVEISESVKKYEPEIALFSDNEGYEFIDDWSRIAFGFLKSNGTLLFEIGFDQAERSISLLKGYGFREVNVLKDLSGQDRILIGKK